MSGELSAALRGIEQRHGAWHCWTSDKGCLWATTPQCLDPHGSGTTVAADGGSLANLEQAIAKVEVEWARYGRAA